MEVYLGIKLACQVCAIIFWMGSIILLVTGKQSIIVDANEWLEKHVVVGTALVLVVFFGVMSVFLAI